MFGFDQSHDLLSRDDLPGFFGPYIKSFNGKFRDECLNDLYFTSLARTRAKISIGGRSYNETRPQRVAFRPQSLQHVIASKHNQPKGSFSLATKALRTNPGMD